MQLQKTPYPTDLLRNNPEWVIRTSPNRSEGVRFHRIYNVSSLTAGTLLIETPHGSVALTVTAGARDNRAEEIATAATPAAAYEQLLLKVVYHHMLRQHYDIKARYGNSECTLEFKALEPVSGDIVAVTSSGNMYDITVRATLGKGRKATPKEGYRILTRFELPDGTHTPELYLDDSNGIVTVGSAMLAAYISKPGIPRANEQFAAIPCPEHTISARLLYAESYEGTTGVVKMSPWVTLLNAKVVHEDFLNNRGDWKSADALKLWRKNDIDIHGQDNGDTVRTDTVTEQYLYISNLTGAEIRKTATVTINDDEYRTETTAELVFPAMTICRIPCGWKAVSNLFQDRRDTPVKWHISIPTETAAISRTFLTRPRPYRAVTALLLNRCNLYESIVFETVAEETKTETQKLETGSGTIHLTETLTDTLILRTGKRTAKDIALLKEAIAKTENLTLEGDNAWRISFEQASLTLSDTDKDLMEAEVRAVKRERVNRAAVQAGGITAETVISEYDTQLITI